MQTVWDQILPCRLLRTMQDVGANVVTIERDARPMVEAVIAGEAGADGLTWRTK